MSTWQAGDGPALVALSGPPVGALLFRHLARPISEAGRRLIAPELFHPPGESSVDALAERLAPVVPRGAVLLAHGLALPLAMAVAERVPVAGLVISNGPLEQMDPVSRAMSRLASYAPGGVERLLRPGRFLPLIASSAALRRTVTNPYALDRDTVAMLSLPLISTAEHRRAVVQYLASIGRMRAPWRVPDVPVLLVWGVADLLHPLPSDPDRLIRGARSIDAVSLAGARLFALEERPWEFARAILEWWPAPQGE